MEIMKKAFLSGIAATIALTVSMSGAVLAAPSVSGNSVSGNSVSGNSTSATSSVVQLTDEEREEIRVNNIIRDFVNKASTYLLGRADSSLAKAQSGYVAVNTDNGKVAVAPDYSAVTDKEALVSVTAAKKDKAVETLSDYVKQAAPAATKVIGPVKLQMFKAGKPVWDNFGTFTVTFSVDKSFNGKTASVYQIHKDGTVTKTDVKVADGKIPVALQEMGSVAIAIQ